MDLADFDLERRECLKMKRSKIEQILVVLMWKVKHVRSNTSGKDPYNLLKLLKHLKSGVMEVSTKDLYSSHNLHFPFKKLTFSTAHPKDIVPIAHDSKSYRRRLT